MRIRRGNDGSRHGGERRRAAPSRRGFTLLELMLVMALLSVVLGVGLGLFSAVNPAQRAAVSLVQNIIRSAHNSAVARGSPARVRLTETTLRGEELRVIGTWHFESESLAGAFGLAGVALEGSGRLTDDGYQGRALSFLDDRRGGRVEVAVQNDPAFDFRDGFAVDLAVRVEALKNARLLSIGRSFRVDVTAQGGVKAYLVPELKDELGDTRPGGRVFVNAPPGALQPGHWRRLRLAYDRRVFSVSVDGVELARTPSEAPVWKIDDPLVLSGDQQVPFPGSVDSLVVSAVAETEEATLPDGVWFAKGYPAQIVFEPGGGLDPSVHESPIELTLEFEEARRETVRVTLYGTVE